MAYIFLHVLASAFSNLLSNSPLNHSTLDTLGTLAMSWTWQASCTCHSLYVPPEFTWPILSLHSSFCSNVTSSKRPSQEPCVNQLYPLWRKEIKIKNQGTGCHKTETWVYSVKMSNVLNEQDYTVNNRKMSPSVTVQVLKLKEDRFWCFHFHRMLNKATVFITIFQNIQQSGKDVLTGQNKIITQTKILDETKTQQEITWRFLLPGMLNKLLPDPILLQMGKTLGKNTKK